MNLMQNAYQIRLDFFLILIHMIKIPVCGERLGSASDSTGAICKKS
jgi:hypothetical protein